jgi:hypothetical protein
MNTIEPIHTCCKKCVFAKYDNLTQVDCYLNYIEKYKDKNIQVIEAFDDDNEFFVINNKKCIGYRENKWFENRNLANSTIEEKINEFKKSNNISYVCVIDLKKLNINQLENIVETVSNIAISPTKLVLIRYVDKDKRFSYEAIEKIFRDKMKKDIGWRIQTMIDDSLSYEYILYDIAKNNKKARFILSIKDCTDEAGFLIDRANNKVYNELEDFYIACDSKENVHLFSSTVYRHLFNSNENMFDKKDLYHYL